MKIVYTPEVIEDLARLREFIETNNPEAAGRIANSLLDGVKKLKRFPHIGIQVSKAPNPELMRDLVLGNYVARYLVLEKTINILRIWHQREEERYRL